MFFVYTLVLIVTLTPLITRRMLDHSGMNLNDQCATGFIFVMIVSCM